MFQKILNFFRGKQPVIEEQVVEKPKELKVVLPKVGLTSSIQYIPNKIERLITQCVDENLDMIIGLNGVSKYKIRTNKLSQDTCQSCIQKVLSGSERMKKKFNIRPTSEAILIDIEVS